MKRFLTNLTRFVNVEVEIAGLTLKNPILPAAGPPVLDGQFMIDCIEQGNVGAIVSKTVSSKGAEVPRPCMTKLGKASMLNHELWSDYTWEHWVDEEFPKVREAHPDVVFIASLGYNKDDITTVSPKLVEDGHADALELSIHYLGDDPSDMMDSIRAAKESTGGKVPIFPKLSPNIPNIQDFALAAEEAGADAIVCINSVGPCLAIDVETGWPKMGGGPHGYGWLSGEAIKPIALRCVYDVASVVEVPVIGCGGITHGVDVVEYIMAGASAVQICTAAIYEGPKVYKKILKQFTKFMDSHGYEDIESIRGIAIENNKTRLVNYLEKTVPTVVEDNCIQCGKCVKACVYSAITHEKKQFPTIDAEKCYGCGLCRSFCKENALSVEYWMN